MLGLNSYLLFPLILLALPLKILFTDNCQFCHKWSVVQMTCSSAARRGCAASRNSPGAAAAASAWQRADGPPAPDMAPGGGASRKQLIHLGSALPNPETEPLKSQVPKISISAADVISDE